MINKDTKLFGSFSNNPGNNGCQFFNTAFEKFNINAIYKSFYSDNIEETVQSVKHLKFDGFALSMPLKISVYNHLDVYDESVTNIGSCNTVIIKDGKLHGYNTDWVGVYKFFENKDLKHVNIIGTGGFAKSIMYAFSKLNINFSIVSRQDIQNIDVVENQYFINATPIEIISTKNTIIDARPFTDTGKEIFLHQAKEQFKLYTGVDYE
jgi:shikimate dehydrogenase